MEKDYSIGSTVAIRISTGDETLAEWLNAQSNVSESIKAVLRKNVAQNGIVNLSQSSQPNLPKENEIKKVIYDHLLSKGNEPTVPLNELYDAVEKNFNLSGADVNYTSPKTGESIFRNRVRWAIQNLKKLGIIESPQRGEYKLSSFGILVSTIGGLEHYHSVLEANHINQLIQKDSAAKEN